MDPVSIQSSFFQEFFDICIQQINKEENKNKIKTYIVEPSLTFIFDRLYPYIVLTCVIFFLLIMLCIIILFIFIRNHQNLIKNTISV